MALVGTPLSTVRRFLLPGGLTGHRPWRQVVVMGASQEALAGVVAQKAAVAERPATQGPEETAEVVATQVLGAEAVGAMGQEMALGGMAAAGLAYLGKGATAALKGLAVVVGQLLLLGKAEHTEEVEVEVVVWVEVAQSASSGDQVGHFLPTLHKFNGSKKCGSTLKPIKFSNCTPKFGMLFQK